jgi:hypothetical protein
MLAHQLANIVSSSLFRFERNSPQAQSHPHYLAVCAPARKHSLHPLFAVSASARKHNSILTLLLSAHQLVSTIPSSLFRCQRTSLQAELQPHSFAVSAPACKQSCILTLFAVSAPARKHSCILTLRLSSHQPCKHSSILTLLLSAHQLTSIVASSLFSLSAHQLASTAASSHLRCHRTSLANTVPSSLFRFAHTSSQAQSYPYSFHS